MSKLYKIRFYKVARERFSPEIPEQLMGSCRDLPKVGERFSLWKSAECNNGLFPDMSTNVVSNIIYSENKITFTTKSNSVYEIEILEITED